MLTRCRFGTSWIWLNVQDVSIKILQFSTVVQNPRKLLSGQPTSMHVRRNQHRRGNRAKRGAGMNLIRKYLLEIPTDCLYITGWWKGKLGFIITDPNVWIQLRHQSVESGVRWYLNNTGSNSPEDKPTWDCWGNDKISCTFHRKINSDGKWDFLWESGASVEPGLSLFQSDRLLNVYQGSE